MANFYLDDDWGDDGWDDKKNAPKQEKPAAKYEMGEVIDDFYPDNHEDLALMRSPSCPF